jgi:ribonuclease VapC
VIVDTSAIVTVLLEEPDAVLFAQAIAEANVPRLSAATYVEIGLVIDRRRNPFLSLRIDRFLEEANMTLEPVTERQARMAREAHLRYGRGSGHRARLNFGDCFAYALARDKDEPLLFKGTDFAHTDVRRAFS